MTPGPRNEGSQKERFMLEIEKDRQKGKGRVRNKENERTGVR